MSLLDEFKTDFAIVEKTRVPDGEGGYTTTWAEGVTIKVIQRHDTTIQAQVAEGQQTASAYTFLVDKSVNLDYHDVLKRVSDGQYFRITSLTGEDYTPSTSQLNLTSVTAEKWSLTT